jgi:hypothetical protein
MLRGWDGDDEGDEEMTVMRYRDGDGDIWWRRRRVPGGGTASSQTVAR